MSVISSYQERTWEPPSVFEQAAPIDRVSVVRWNELSAQQRIRWQELRSSQAEFKTPFFSLSFFDCVHASRNDVWVALLGSGDQLAGFLPFQMVKNVAWPAGRYLNDAHNVVMHPNTRLDWRWLLKQLEVKAFDFHALVGSRQSVSEGSVWGTTESFSADLGCDSRSFLTRLQRDHKTIYKQGQKSRKMARELGSLSLEIDCQDPSTLAQTIIWKRDQYRRTNILDLFTPDWTRELMNQLHQRRGDDTRGFLSVLRAGETVVAAHYGMIEGGLLHYWFPTYDPRFSQYSPGTALFMEIVRESSAHGIQCIDMGYGEQPYKRKQTDTITSVAHGCVSNSIIYCQWRAIRAAASSAVKKVPMKAKLKHILRRMRPEAGISKLG